MLWRREPFPGAYFAADFLRRKYRLNGVRKRDVTLLSGWSFARASAAYGTTQGGVLQSFASGVPRITDKGLLPEAAATNLCLYSGDQTNAAWTATNMTVAMNAVGPDGVANSAATLTATAGNATLTQSFTIASAVKDFSFYMRRVTGSGNIDMTLDNGTGWTTKTLTTQWQRFDITQTLANPVIGVRIVTNGDVIEVYGSGLEATGYATSYIPTTTASVTRAADVISIGSITGLDYPLTLFAEFERASDTGATETLFSVDDGDATDRAELYVSSADGTRLHVRTASVLNADISLGAATSVGTIYKAAMRVAANDVNGARNGVAGTVDTTVTVPATPARILIGSNATPTYAHAYLRRLAIFPSAYTDAQLQELTR